MEIFEERIDEVRKKGNKKYWVRGTLVWEEVEKKKFNDIKQNSEDSYNSTKIKMDKLIKEYDDLGVSP